jgi:hypothetical protein
MTTPLVEARHEVAQARQAIIDLTGSDADDEAWNRAWERLDRAEHHYEALTGQTPTDAFLLGDDVRSRMGHRIAARYEVQHEGMRRRTR